MALVFHLTERATWDRAQSEGAYRGSTLGRALDEVGFVHCSYRDQVAGVANALYRGRDDVVVLVVDTERLRVPVRVERPEGAAEAFPHVYGPIPLAAVVDVVALPAGADGGFDAGLPPAMDAAAQYTFGDDAPAVERLRLVAEAYAPTSRAFLGRAAPPWPSLAVDAGCGPGFTTRLVADVCQPRTLIGVDTSPAFLAVASEVVPAASFEIGDVVTDPLAGSPVDLVYARLVLAHLPDPLATADRWRAQLAPRGSVLIEDLEAIEAPEGPLRDYEEVSAAVVRAGGGRMYAGADLAGLGGTTVAVRVPAARAAAIYVVNARRWREHGVGVVDASALEDLEAGLARTAAEAPPGEVAWIVRQVVLRA